MKNITKTIKTLAAMMMVVVVATGCTSMQQSVYRNESVAGQTRIFATGKAAVAAATTSTSHNCPSCAPGQENNNGGSGQYQPEDRRSMTDKVMESASSAIERKISYEISRAIDRL